MALSITATVQPDTYSVQLAITGGAPEYVVTAYPAGDAPEYVVRSTYSPVTGDPTGRVAVDGAVPLETETQYVVTDSAGVQASSALVTVHADGPVLSDATDPTRVLRVVVLDQIPFDSTARSVWWTVLGRADPFVSVAPMLYPGGTCVLYAATRTDRAQIRALLAPGNPLQLRAPCPDDLDDLVMLVDTVSEKLVLDSRKGGSRRFELTYQAVSTALGTYAGDPGRTYAQLLDVAADYFALRALYPTYADVLTGSPYAGLSAELLTDGGFTAGTGAAWSTFWTSGGTSWTWTGSGKASTPGDGSYRSVLVSNSTLPSPGPGRGIPAGVTKLRVTGRVRCTDPGATVKLELLTNDVSGTANYFQPGVNSSVVPLTATSAYTPFVVEVPIVGVAQVWAGLWFRADNLQDASTAQIVEWDDLSARWVL